MKKYILNSLFILFSITILMSGCTTVSKTMKEPNVRVDINLSDFDLSEQASAEASSTKIIGIDFTRLYLKKTGTVEGNNPLGIYIPVIGNQVSDKTAQYALYELMQNNQGYDVVFYPQFETTVVKPILGLGLLKKESTVKVTARLGKLGN